MHTNYDISIGHEKPARGGGRGELWNKRSCTTRAEHGDTRAARRSL